MKSINPGKYIVFSLISLMVVAAGLILIKTMPDAQGVMSVLPYLCVGIGSGLFGHNIGEIVKGAVVKRHPDTLKKIEVEANDERNIAISNKAKAKAYDLMLIVFAALLLAFATMNMNLYMILALVAAYLFIVFSNIYYLNKYQKEM